MLTSSLADLHIRLDPTADPEWQQLLAALPDDLETSARHYGAFRRKRQLQSAADLLRLAFAYAGGLSLDTIAGRAAEVGIVDHISDNVLDVHFAKMVPWLSYLIGRQLAGASATFPWHQPLRIRLLDASVLCRPGASGTDWRLHLGLDLRTGLIDHLSVTGDNIAERLADFPLEPGDLVLADRGYSTREGVTAVQRRQAYSLIRINTHNLPLQGAEGGPFDLLAALGTLAPGQQGEWAVCTTPTATLPAVPGRLVAYALSEEAAATARHRVRQTARKKGRTPLATTLVTAGYVLLFTTVPPAVLTTGEVLQVYRMRWQIELAFKREKSALHLDDIRATTDAVCYMVILARCLLLLLLEQVAWTTGLFSPSGDAAETDESLSLLPGLVSDDPAHCVTAPDLDGVEAIAAQCADTLFFRATTPPDLAA